MPQIFSTLAAVEQGSIPDYGILAITLIMCAGTLLTTAWIVGSRVGSLITALHNINATMQRFETIVERTVEIQGNQTTQIAVHTTQIEGVRESIAELRVAIAAN